MKAHTIDHLVRQADRFVDTARRELLRADEDVITYTVCINSRQALTNYLTAFLLENGIRPERSATLESLLTQCRALDARFEAVSLEGVYCRNAAGPNDYCLTVEQVESCLGVAQQTKGIIHAVAPGY